jgi:hypothetical protein
MVLAATSVFLTHASASTKVGAQRSKHDDKHRGQKRLPEDELE